MRYPREFFAVQLAFAQKIADLSQQMYPEVVLHNTALYRILGLDWSFDPSNPLWQAYCEGLQREKADIDWTYRFYLALLEDIPEYDQSRAHWGCFSYEYVADEQAVRLHFAGVLDASGYGPLTSLRKEARVTELRSMFTSIKEKDAATQLVQGGSWLYNRHEYKRLFPPEYGQAARIDQPHLRARGLWGQFLRHNGKVNEQVASLFLERLDQLREADQYAQCFPYQAMRAEAPIGLFYTFYGIR